jgi:Rod binding domain-containing protein
MLYVNPLESSVGSLTRVDSPGAPGREKLALQELEHTFLFTLLQEMRKTEEPDALLPSGRDREMYDEMLDDALSSEMAKSGQLGLAKQMQQMLEAAQHKGVKAALAPVDLGKFTTLDCARQYETSGTIGTNGIYATHEKNGRFASG